MKDSYYHDSKVSDILNYMDRFDLLSEEETNKLLIEAKNGDIKAINKLIVHNHGLIVNIAKQYNNKGLDLSELMQEGVFGFYDAIKRFDFNHNTKFSTYVSVWIRSYIRVALYKNRGIPKQVFLDVRHLSQTENRLTVLLERKPTDLELSEALDYKVDKIKQLKTARRFLKKTNINEKVQFDGGKNYFLADNIVDPDWDYTEEIIDSEIKTVINNWIENSSLTDREKSVIKLYFGFEGKRYTLVEIGKYLNLTKETIRLTKIKALEKLKNSEYAKDAILYNVNQPSLNQLQSPKK